MNKSSTTSTILHSVQQNNK